MSIGAVLGLLKAEFDDVTVSKIRFLETEGLLEPERTASGYRKFYPADIERLRLILRLQRDSFLPLRVIKERLEAGLTDVPPPGAPQPVARAVEAAASVPEPEPVPPDEDFRVEPPAVRLTESDLADAASLELGQINELVTFGVLKGSSSIGAMIYDHDDLRIAEIARDLIKLGIPPRNLRTLRRIADQEADLLHSVVAPSLANRRAEARRQAIETLGELSEHARRLRAAMLAANLRRSVNGNR